jgi:hypothetical protein
LYYYKQCGRGELPTIPRRCNEELQKGDNEFRGHHFNGYIALGCNEPNDPPITFSSV